MISVNEQTPPVDETGDPALRDAIGRNADYYLRRWRDMDTRGSKLSWNWPACLLNLYWFAWRKLWGALALLLVALVLLGVVGAAGQRAAQLSLLASIGLSFVTGGLGNHLYRRKCRRLVEASSGMDPEAARAFLLRHGGTSNLALAISLVVSALLLTLSIAGLMAQRRQQQVGLAQPARVTGAALASSPELDGRIIGRI